MIEQLSSTFFGFIDFICKQYNTKAKQLTVQITTAVIDNLATCKYLQHGYTVKNALYTVLTMRILTQTHHGNTTYNDLYEFGFINWVDNVNWPP